MRRSLERRQKLEASLAKLPNKNRPSHYLWMKDFLLQLSEGVAPMVADHATKAEGTPLFVVAGACPSSFAGMQCVLYSAMSVAGESAAKEDVYID